MIQFNLLPDVKQQYVKAQSQKKLITTISVLVSGFFVIIAILMVIFVKVGQTHHLSSLSKNISAHTAKLKETKDLDKILTVQNQLSSLPDLHKNKVVSSRLFDYLVKLTPTKATISDVTLDVASSTLSIQGSADSLATVNKFVDTVKFTKYTAGVGDSAKKGPAFSNVVLSSFSVTSSTGSAADTNKQVSYKIDFSYDPIIFANSFDSQNKPVGVDLTVPNIISTRSEIDKPGSVFDEQTSNSQGGNL